MLHVRRAGLFSLSSDAGLRLAGRSRARGLAHRWHWPGEAALADGGSSNHRRAVNLSRGSPVIRFQTVLNVTVARALTRQSFRLAVIRWTPFMIVGTGIDI